MAGVAVIWLVIIGTSIWVAVDSSNIGARKGLVKGSGNMGPAGWFFCCLLIWIIGFPVYLAKRSEIKAAAAASNVSVPTPVNAGQVAQNSVASPPGWYPPVAQSQQRVVEDTASDLTSKADELVKFDALRQSGVLTQEEFNAEKAKLLRAPLPLPTHPA
jgi:hypothetical protein